MKSLLAVPVVIGVLALVALALSPPVVQQYGEGLLFRLGRPRRLFVSTGRRSTDDE
jgi:hypothetical protein